MSEEKSVPQTKIQFVEQFFDESISTLKIIDLQMNAKVIDKQDLGEWKVDSNLVYCNEKEGYGVCGTPFSMRYQTWIVQQMSESVIRDERFLRKPPPPPYLIGHFYDEKEPFWERSNKLFDPKNQNIYIL